ncbi:MAG: hypothetical protein ACFE9Z_06610 [Promethearchaeota archaeon]
MPGPFDELEKEAENLERQSKEEFNKKNFILAISLLEEAKEMYSKLGYQGKMGMIDRRIFQLKNVVKFSQQDSEIKTKGELELKKQVDQVLKEKERHGDKKLEETKALSPEMSRNLEKIDLILEKAEKEEKLGRFSRVIGRYEYILKLYKSIPRDVANFTNKVYEIEKKLSYLRQKL